MIPRSHGDRRGEAETGGGFLAFVLMLAVVGGVAVFTPRLKALYDDSQKTARDKQSVAASASAEFKDSITLAGDPWSGYFIFRSQKMHSLLEHAGVRYSYETEEDLGKRFAGLASGKYDAVVATIDGYTLNGLASNYPGVITWVIDESYGGDAIVGGPKLGSLDDFERLADLPRVAYAESYPSEHLLNAMLIQFHKTVKRVPVKSSSAAFELLKSGQVDAAVLWEPETSNAARMIPGSKVLLSTRDMVDFIVDVAILSRKLVLEKPELASQLSRAYFSTLKYFQGDPAKLVEEIAKDAAVTEEVGKTVADGIRFIGLGDNAFRWFGVGGPDATEKMSRIIRETVQIQKERLPAGTLPDPFYILNRAVLTTALAGESDPALARKFKVAPDPVKPSPVKTRSFANLSDAEWDAAQVLGTLEVAPIYFSSGSSDLDEPDTKRIDVVAEKLIHYPALRLKVVGHSSPGGDAAASEVLSVERSRSVAGYLARTHGLPQSRVHATGAGGSSPLPRKSGEPERAWRSRCQRVEFILVSAP